MDVSLLIKNRLSELALDQKDLAAAVQVTESYISQLLARKKVPPAPERTELYTKIGQFLQLPPEELSKLAGVQRQAEMKKKVEESPQPLFKDCRELIVRKCRPECRDEVEQIFQKEPFGEFERLLTQKILEVAQTAAVRTPGTGVCHISIDGCAPFLEPIVESWTIDLKTFQLEIVLQRRFSGAGVRVRRLEFVERVEESAEVPVEPGFRLFLADESLSGDAKAEEIAFLRTLRFEDRKPSPLYYYRELQSLRDPLHFPQQPGN